ncbi:MAG: dTDP-4-dehydrorhamnose 3,5-epimerase [Acidobacteria bacterium]|nr:dTDP-4-dehydrorhamnose 3,5-epimerase [Acidobacteriota bacterium]
MKKIATDIAGLYLIEPTVWQDERGYFFEVYHQEKFSALGIRDHFVQDNQSKSVQGTLRGLHYQIAHPQAKLCRVIYGAVLDIAVDIRRGSPTFGKYVSAILSADNKRQMFIPAGFAHGYLVLSESAEFVYKCSDFYHPEAERGVLWKDPELAIAWGFETPTLSAKDARHLPLSQIAAEDLPVYSSDR